MKKDMQIMIYLIFSQIRILQKTCQKADQKLIERKRK